MLAGGGTSLEENARPRGSEANAGHRCTSHDRGDRGVMFVPIIDVYTSMMKTQLGKDSHDEKERLFVAGTSGRRRLPGLPGKEWDGHESGPVELFPPGARIPESGKRRTASPRSPIAVSSHPPFPHFQPP